MDVHGAEAPTVCVVESRPNLEMRQFTDLPDDPAAIPARAAANSRIQLDDADRRTVPLMETASGVVVLADPEG